MTICVPLQVLLEANDHKAGLWSSKGEREGRKTGQQCLRLQCSCNESSRSSWGSHPAKTTIRAVPYLPGTELFSTSASLSHWQEAALRKLGLCANTVKRLGPLANYYPVIRDTRCTFSWLPRLAEQITSHFWQNSIHALPLVTEPPYSTRNQNPSAGSPGRTIRLSALTSPHWKDGQIAHVGPISLSFPVILILNRGIQDQKWRKWIHLTIKTRKILPVIPAT